jgi:hypothetical protein
MQTISKSRPKSGSLSPWIALAVFAALAFSVQAYAQRIITYDAPGAGKGAGQGTEAPGINSAGAITGFYWDDLSVAHGFVRDFRGEVTTFDAPGAGSETVPGFYAAAVGLGGQGTYGIAINHAGAIAGTYIDKDNVMHGFRRDPDGRFTTIDVPGAGSGFAEGTEADNINSEGTIAGTYVDANNVLHGFVRDPDGRITRFSVRGAGTEAGQGTLVEWAQCLNDAGMITGNYVDASGVSHGYVRAPDGKITKFDVEVAGTGAGQGTIGENINSAGVIAGDYIDAGGAAHGLVRDPWGRITKFDVEGAGTGAGQGTIPFTNNSSGAITGAYIDKDNVLHGFVRWARPGLNW